MLKKIKNESGEPLVYETKVKLEFSYFEKIAFLDEYYIWLFENDYSANDASVVAKYKQHLKQQFLNEKD